MYIFGRYFAPNERMDVMVGNESFSPNVRALMAVYAAANGRLDVSLTWFDLSKIQQQLINEIGRQPFAYPVPDATLRDISTNKIGAIKDLRERTGLGLKEAKDYVEAIMKIKPYNPQPEFPEVMTINGATYRKV